MNILICTPNLTGGGAENQINLLVKGLLKRGHCVSVCFIREGPTKAEYHDGVKYYQYTEKNKILIFYQLWKTLREHKYNIVLSSNLLFDILLGILNPFYNFSLFIRESNSEDARQGSIKNQIRLFLNRNVFIISNNKSGLKMWKKNGNNGKIILNGFEINAKDFSQKERSCILIGGRFIKRKKIIESIKLANQCPALSRFPIVLFGDGPEKDQILKEVHDLAIEIKFLGFIPNDKLTYYMRSARFFISLSDYEGTPNLVLESLICGCDIILSDVPSHRDYFPDDIVSYVADCSDYGSLTEANFKSKSRKRKKEFLMQWSDENMVDEYVQTFELFR